MNTPAKHDIEHSGENNIGAAGQLRQICGLAVLAISLAASTVSSAESADRQVISAAFHKPMQAVISQSMIDSAFAQLQKQQAQALRNKEQQQFSHRTEDSRYRMLYRSALQLQPTGLTKRLLAEK